MTRRLFKAALNNMSVQVRRNLEIPWELVEAIKAFPLRREVAHCGKTFTVAPFEFYADCPECGRRIKVRACSGVTEIEEVFDAVFEWMNQPQARELAQNRQQIIEADGDSDEELSAGSR
jgi:hypothetical protein